VRISTSMIHSRAIQALQRGLATMARAQAEVATGRRIRTVSDDPADAAEVMRLDSLARENDQLVRNGASATTRLSVEDAVLTSAGGLMSQLRQLTVTAAATGPGDPALVDLLREVRLLRDQLVDLGNTRVGTDHLFGGGQSLTPPFLADGTYVGDSSPRRAEIGRGVTIATSHTGDALFQDAFAAIAAIEAALVANNPGAIGAILPQVDAARTGMLEAQAEVGSWLGSVREAGTRLARESALLLDRRDALRDVDPATASVRLVAAQTALERAYAAVGRVLETDFLQYLR
jgi:flagellar hook-associated protein 3 FlgL